MTTERTIIPVASGKGGVGKSLLTANLAIAIAEKGHSTIAVDLDLGNSNLHSLLGLPNNFPGIGDFLRTKADSLEEFLVATEISNLRFIPGDGRMPFMANFTHHQKLKLIEEIKKLKAKYVLMDLSAGSHNNILDLYGIANRGIIVTVPEPPSIKNMLVFLKNYILRQIECFTDDTDLIKILKEMYTQPVWGPQKTVQTFRDKIAEINPNIAAKIDEICKKTRPRFIYNMGEVPGDLEMLPKIDNTLKKVFSLNGDHLGFVFYDQVVRKSIKQGIPLLKHQSAGRTIRSIRLIADRIVDFWNHNYQESARLLREHTQKVFDQQMTD